MNDEKAAVYKSEIEIGRPPFLGGGIWKLTGFTPISVILGKNGSGKSFLLRKWRDTNLQQIHYVIPERAGEIGFDAGLLAVEIDPQGRRNRAQHNFQDGYRQGVVARIQAYFLARGTSDDEKLRGKKEHLEALIDLVLADFTVKLIGTQNPPYFLLRRGTDERITTVQNLSSGEAQMFALAVDITTIGAIWALEERAERLLLIDEPDAHIHPDLQVRFAEFLVAVANKYSLQVVIATHSLTLLSALAQYGKQDVSVFYLVRGASEHAAQKFSDVLQELTTCLGGHVLMGPLFKAPLLLVEGDDDYKLWSQVPRHGMTNIAVIPCQGAAEVKRYQRTLERMFAAISDAKKILGYALLDSDQPMPQASPENQQEFVRFTQIACHETENLYLSDEVLQSMGTNWERASAAIMEKARDYGEKALKLDAVARADRKTADLKGVMDQLVQIIDSKKVPWTRRVAALIGSEKPTGQLADFLGGGVMAAFWP